MRTILLLLLLLLSCGEPSSPPPEETTAEVASVAWADRIAALDQRLAVAEGRAARQRRWVRHQQVADLRLERARLSGDDDDVARAEAALERAFALAPRGEGPWLSRAELDAWLQRFDRVEPALAEARRRPLLSTADQVAITLLAAEAAARQGRIDEALRGYAAAFALERGPGPPLGLARLLWRTGELEAAAAQLDEAGSLWSEAWPETVASLHVEQARLALERGRVEEALARLDEADRAMPGWWKADHERARALAFLGRTEEAVLLVGTAAGRTPDPAVLDTLASLLRDRGEEDEARRIAGRAGRAWAERVARWPESSLGPAVDHHLQFGPDPATTLALAERHAALAPDGESLARLAEARLAAGRVVQARRAVEQVLASPWRSARIHAAAARIYEAAGEAGLADEQRRAARALRLDGSTG